MVQKVPCEGTDAAGVGGKVQAENAANMGGNTADISAAKFRRCRCRCRAADTEYVYICNRYITNIYIFLYISVANVSN